MTGAGGAPPTPSAPVPVEVRQRSGVHQPQLHGLGQKLWPAAGVHHPVQPGAKRHGRTRDQNAQRPMRTSPPLRDTAARQSCDRRLDRLLAMGMKTPAEAYALAA